jgi:hypothetical protein
MTSHISLSRIYTCMEFLLACFFRRVAIGYWLFGMPIKKLLQIHKWFFEQMYALNSQNISCHFLLLALSGCAKTILRSNEADSETPIQSASHGSKHCIYIYIYIYFKCFGQNSRASGHIGYYYIWTKSQHSLLFISVVLASVGTFES